MTKHIITTLCSETVRHAVTMDYILHKGVVEDTNLSTWHRKAWIF